MRRVLVVGLIATLTAASVDLGACGDKFLRVGRSARFRRYAAVHPASILIYKLGATPSKPGLLPILYKPSKAVEAEAEQQYACLIKPHVMTKYDALAEIDRFMQLQPRRASTLVGK
jgi:hypothetical protein